MNRLNNTTFTAWQDLAQSLTEIDMSGESYEFGGIPMIVKENKVYVDSTDSHTIIFGSTGSKKTRMFVMPTVEILSRAGESYFVSDPKGEVYERTAGGAKKRGYNVCCLNFRDFSNGISWNPFTLAYDLFHAGDKRRAFELIGDIVAALFKTDNNNDLFWAETSMNVVNGFILLMFDMCTREECNLKTLIRMWNEYRTSREIFLKKIRKEYKGTIIYNKLCCLDTASDKTTGSIDAYVDMGINKLAINEEFINYLSSNSLELADVVRKKTAVYLIVPDESEYYHFVIGLFVKQLYMVLVDYAQEQKNNMNRMNFILDEFCNIPQIPEFSNMITAARSRNIRFCLIVQSKKQLVEKYGNNADVILGNSSNWIYLYSREVALLNEISQLCGEVIYDNGMRVPLISPFELQHLSKEEGEALMLIGRHKPCITKLPDISQYPFESVELKVKRTKKQKKIDTSKIKVKSKSAFSEKTDNPYVYENMSGFITEWSRKNDEGSRVWLVATYKGMILEHIVTTQRNIQTGFAMQQIFVKNQDLYDAREELRWYKADVKVWEEYVETLNQHPEYVFLTIDELNRSNFRLVEWKEDKKNSTRGERTRKYLHEDSQTIVDILNLSDERSE